MYSESNVKLDSKEPRPLDKLSATVSPNPNVPLTKSRGSRVIFTRDEYPRTEATELNT